MRPPGARDAPIRDTFDRAALAIAQGRIRALGEERARIIAQSGAVGIQTPAWRCQPGVSSAGEMQLFASPEAGKPARPAGNDHPFPAETKTRTEDTPWWK